MTPDWQKIRELEEMLEAREAALKSCHLTITVLHSRIRDLEAQLKGQAVGGEVGTWIACSERMPLTGLTVIVEGGCAFFDGLVWRSMMGYAAAKQIEWRVTHWMPLPPAPPVQPKGDE